MNIALVQTMLSDRITEKKQVTTQSNGFSEILKNTTNLLKETQAMQQEVTEKTNDFMLNKNDNIHELMITQEKANIMLQYTTQVRNNVLEAYREIMRITL